MTERVKAGRVVYDLEELEPFADYYQPSSPDAADSDRDAQPSYHKPQVEERGKLRPRLVAGSGPPLPP